jgi:transcriptional regulator with XRE-family HTH domain
VTSMSTLSQTPLATIQERLFAAYLALCAREGTLISQRELVRRIAVQSKHRMSDSTFSRWLNDGAMPELTMVPHIARVLGVDAGWIAFGDQSAAPAPELGVVMGSALMLRRGGPGRPPRHKK